MNLKNKRILITAGPTWVPIDSVRVISNIATGQTGISLANKCSSLGAKVTLFLGPQKKALHLKKDIALVNFRFFDELKNLLNKELKSKRIDILIHSAAVSDYRPAVSFKKKIKSGSKNLSLKLLSTPKLIDSFRKRAPNAILVGFKFEPNENKDKLIADARSLIRRSGIDLAVANTISSFKYRAYIVTNSVTIGPLKSKASLIDRLIKFIGE